MSKGEVPSRTIESETQIAELFRIGKITDENSRPFDQLRLAVRSPWRSSALKRPLHEREESEEALRRWMGGRIERGQSDRARP
jgi:hypothetical protein